MVHFVIAGSKLMCGVVCVACLVGSSRPVAADECCPADLVPGDEVVGDDVVDAEDLASLLAWWGPCDDCSADLDDDGTVDAADLAVLLGSWGSCLFAYPDPPDNTEAEQIGLEMLGHDGPLLVPPELYRRIDRDLALIRKAEPSLVDQTHTPAWITSQLGVTLVEDAPQSDYLCLNKHFQIVDAINGFDNWWLLVLPGNVNVVALVEIYQALPEVQLAEMAYVIGGDDFWVPTPLADGVWRWDVDDGWHDCYDGCDCHRYYTFETDPQGQVSLISFQEVGYPWCVDGAGR